MTYEEAQKEAQRLTGETASYSRRGWVVELPPFADFEVCLELEDWFETNLPDGPPVSP